jgi:hypothetical protein
MEATMHGSFERSGEADNHTHQRPSAAFFAIPAFIAVVLAGLMLTLPSASIWISQAAQAEFAGVYPPPEAAPTQLAQPAAPIRTVKAVN